MNRKEELEAQIKALSGELNAIKEAEYSVENAALLGKCYRVRNNYSCPEKPSDYWWLYVKVTDASDGLRCLRFEVDKDGRVTVEPRTYYMSQSLASYEPITEREFQRAWDKCVTAVSVAYASRASTEPEHPK